MPVFDSPTINDFLSQLHMQTDRSVRDFLKQKNEITTTCAKAGAINSSRFVLLVLEAVEEHVERGVALHLGELRRALSYPELDAVEIRSHIEPRLIDLTSKIVSAAAIERSLQSLQNEAFIKQIDAKIEQIRLNVRFWLRQFDIGWDEPVKPELLTPPPLSP